MAARSGLTIPKRQVVQTLIANTTGPMKKGLMNAYCPNVVALYEAAASVKENLHEFVVIPIRIRLTISGEVRGGGLNSKTLKTGEKR